MFNYIVRGFITLTLQNGDKVNISYNFQPSDLRSIEEVIAKAASDAGVDENFSVESIEF